MSLINFGPQFHVEDALIWTHVQLEELVMKQSTTSKRNFEI